VETRNLSPFYKQGLIGMEICEDLKVDNIVEDEVDNLVEVIIYNEEFTDICTVQEFNNMQPNVKFTIEQTEQ
jgi:hypothetical protein